MVGQLLLSNWEWLAGVLGAAVALFTARQAGKTKAERNQLQDAEKREKAGRDAVQDHNAQDRDDSPDAIVDRMRRRDGDTGGL